MPTNTGNTWMTAAAGAASGAVGMGVQRLGVNYDYRKQREQQGKLMDMQIEGERRLMELQNQYQLEMWEKTGYGAQKDQMKRAGLNPALMYGMGGGGGQTVGGGMPSVGAGTAHDPNTRGAINGMGILQGAMLAAQIENIKADTKNKLQGADKGWQETHKLEMDNLIQEISQNVDKDGKNTEGNIHNSAAVTQMKQQIEETAKRIELLKQQGLKEEEMTEKINKEIKLLQAEIDWNALEIKGDNIGKIIERIIKLIFKR